MEVDDWPRLRRTSHGMGHGISPPHKEVATNKSMPGNNVSDLLLLGEILSVSLCTVIVAQTRAPPLSSSLICFRFAHLGKQVTARGRGLSNGTWRVASAFVDVSIVLPICVGKQTAQQGTRRPWQSTLKPHKRHSFHLCIFLVQFIPIYF